MRVVLLLAAALLGQVGASAAEFRIEISGTPAVAFKAECQVVRASGAIDTKRFAGLIPRRYGVDAEAVACEVQKRDSFGRLSVRLLADGRLVAATETAAAYDYVRVRSAGPWGKARASRGNIGIPFSEPGKGGGSLPGQTVPRFDPPILPPLRPTR